MKNSFLLVVLAFIVGCKSQQSISNSTGTDSSSVEIVEPQAPDWAPLAHPYQGARKIESDLIHMKLNINFDWEKQYAHGEIELMLEPYFYPQKTLQLDARGFDIHSVKLKSINGEEKDVNFTYDSLVIDIELGKEYLKGEKYFILIDYTAKPNELKEGGSAAITSNKGLYFINPTGEVEGKPKQIWTQGETQANSCWFPTIDSPNEKITQEIYITVDTTYTTISNGSLVYSLENGNGTRTDYWRQEKPHAPYLVMMAIGKFAKVEDHYGDMAVDYYVEKEYEPYAKAIFGNTPEMLKFFSELLDYPYAWEKYSQIVVRDYVSGAMENTSASIFMDALQLTDRELLDQNWDKIIAHELFHHWFGDLVTCESWSNLPLNESFANYSEYLWDEYKYGKEEADMNAINELSQYLNEAQYKREPLIRYNYEDKEDMFDSHSYAKGGRTLHMLRTYVGDKAFFKSLNLYLKQNEFKTVEIHNLRLAFEEITGEDLNWFFDQWFLSLGHPELEVSHSYDELKKELIVNVIQNQDSIFSSNFILPLYIDFWVDGKKESNYVWIGNREEQFKFNCESKPDAILFDGEQQLLGTVKHDKTDLENVNQFRLSDNYIAKYRSLVSYSTDEESATTLDNDTILQMYIDALSDKSWGLRDLAIVKLQNYKGARKDEIHQKLKYLAMNEEKTTVRAQALYALANLIANSSTAEFEENLTHQSFMVCAEALNGYLKSGGENKNMYLKQFVESDNDAFVAVIAEYFAENPDAKNIDWFVNRLNKSEMVTYEVIIFYAELIQKLKDEVDISKGIKLFKKIAIGKEYNFWQKFSSYQAIMIYEKNVEAKEALEFIKNQETDQRLLQYYNYF